MSKLIHFYYSDITITLQFTLPDVMKHLIIYYSIKYATAGYNNKLCFADVRETTAVSRNITLNPQIPTTVLHYFVLNGLTVLLSTSICSSSNNLFIYNFIFLQTPQLAASLGSMYLFKLSFY